MHPFDVHPRYLVVGLAALGLLLLLTRGGGRDDPYISAWRGAPPARTLGTAPAAFVGTAAPLAGRTMGGDTEEPRGNPLQSPRAIMTQGYGVGSHAPAASWGAVDLAIDGDGNGVADPQGSQGAPVYATHRGTVTLSPNSYPAGNHIWVSNGRYKTGYSHLQGFAVRDGQQVEPGDLIGYVGSTGLSSGPHLDYQVWADGVNVNPLDYGAADR
jgi:murein DD-endopeptidase MepM/ murein hydrolase activator NlpD